MNMTRKKNNNGSVFQKMKNSNDLKEYLKSSL